MTGRERKWVGAIGFGILYGLMVFLIRSAIDGWDIGFDHGLYVAIAAVFGYLMGWADCLKNALRVIAQRNMGG